MIFIFRFSSCLDVNRRLFWGKFISFAWWRSWFSLFPIDVVEELPLKHVESGIHWRLSGNNGGVLARTYVYYYPPAADWIVSQAWERFHVLNNEAAVDREIAESWKCNRTCFELRRMQNYSLEDKVNSNSRPHKGARRKLLFAMCDCCNFYSICAELIFQ